MTERESVSSEDAAGVPRIFGGGILMGLANLVPGVSGGTMILAMGLYESFIGALADVSRLRFSRSSLVFLVVLLAGALVALVGLSGLAVGLVIDHRWIMYSLFIGMTLGGAPELWKECKPLRAAPIVSFSVAFALMATLAWGLRDAHIPENTIVFVCMGMLGAASMILPGISGSYMLLLFGMYDVVIGALSASALKEDPTGSLKILVPVGIGAVLGMGLLSNLLKHLLAKFPAASHSALLGLLVGSVLGLWPFRVPTHPELVQKPFRKSVVMLIEGAALADVNAKYGLELDELRAAELRETYAGKSAGDMKRLSDELTPFTPTGSDIGISLALLAGGFALTRLLGKGSSKEATHA